MHLWYVRVHVRVAFNIIYMCTHVGDEIKFKQHSAKCSVANTNRLRQRWRRYLHAEWYLCARAGRSKPSRIVALSWNVNVIISQNLISWYVFLYCSLKKQVYGCELLVLYCLLYACQCQCNKTHTLTHTHTQLVACLLGLHNYTQTSQHAARTTISRALPHQLSCCLDSQTGPL